MKNDKDNRVNFWTVDVFANEPFEGNGAAVVYTQNDISESLKQKIAMELFQSETAFVYDLQNGHFGISFYTPMGQKSEIGHSIFAAAHVLWFEKEIHQGAALYFENNDQIYKINNTEEGLMLSLPLPRLNPTSSPDRLSSALGTIPVTLRENDKRDLIVELHSEEELENLKIDFSKLSSIPYDRVIVTCEVENQDASYVCRVFAPHLGHDEEAITLKPHLDLAAFWSSQMQKTRFSGYQIGMRKGRVNLAIQAPYVTIKLNTILIGAGQFRSLLE